MSTKNKSTDPTQESATTDNAQSRLLVEPDFANRLLNAVPVIVLLLDLKGRTQYVNPYFEQLSGFKLQQVKDKDWFATFLPKPDQDRMRELFQSVARDIPVLGNINPIITNVGEERQIEWFAQTMRDAEAKVMGVLSIGQDVTERNLSNEKFRETSRLLDSIVENVPNMIFLKHASDLSFQFLNRAGEELLGLERAELLGRSDADFFPKQQADFFLSRDREVLQQQGVMDIAEETIETPQGTRILHTQKIAIRDEQGTPQYLLGISEDVTARKQAEDALRAQAVIIDQIHDSVVSTDLKGVITSWNKGAERLFEYSAQDMLGKHIASVYPEEEHAYLQQQLIPTLVAKGAFEAEARMLRRSGEVFDAQLSLSMLFDAQGNASGMIGYSMDISERKRMEAELHAYQEVLEAQVAERTADLVTARDEAEQANAAKSDFLSHMSHELRTPMNAILGFGQMLQLDAGLLNETQQENVNEILNAGQHLLGLINEVLDLAKIEAGKMDVFIQAVSVDELLKQSIALIRSQVAERQLDLFDNISGAGYVVQADSGRLKQVFVNLLSNAMKYNREHGSITLDGVVINQQILRVSVTDTGLGLSKEKIADLFTPFNRLDVSRSIEGAGIGLVITEHLVELMGGSIGVESKTNQGCTFWIELALFGEGPK